MAVMTDVPVALTPEDVLASRRGRPSAAALVQAAEEAIALGASLWQPTAVYEWFDVSSVDGEQVTITALTRDMGAPAVLHIGPKADLLAPARRVLVSVSTIGPALEERVRKLEGAGESLGAFLLDSAGVLALGAVGAAIRCLVEETAEQEGWGVSLGLSPGSLVGWPVQGQRELCALLPLEEIGVQLNRQCVLVPQKSASTIIGIGPGYQAHKVGSVCKFCALAGSCWRRREETV